MARRECAAKYRWRFFPHALIYPFRIFKLGKFAIEWYWIQLHDDMGLSSMHRNGHAKPLTMESAA